MDTRLLHLTGITSALSKSCREIITEALRLAKAKKVPVSFDINYRQNLWTEVEARETLKEMIQDVELLFCGRLDAMRVFGFKGEALDIAKFMFELSGAKHVVITLREQGAVLWDGAKLHHKPACPTKVIDRLDAGDVLAAGVIQGWLDGDMTLGLNYGVTLATMALS